MKILSVVRQNYYGNPAATEPMSVYFTLPLASLGHEVATFDHFAMSRILGRDLCGETLVNTIEKGRFDVVFYQTSGREPLETALLADLSRRFCIAAWNSDDDWQWATTKRIAGHFTFMITTYPDIHQQNQYRFPNLLLSQWGCLGELGGSLSEKDIDFSFAGSIYEGRDADCQHLRRSAGLACFGRGSRLVKLGLPYFRGAYSLPWLAGEPLELSGVYDIWNRSRISYTPLKSSAGDHLQIKGRLFEMGLTGTLVLCEQAPDLDRYYQPGHEVVTFEDLQDYAEKALWYLSHEAERASIAKRYRERTLREHMWEHRFIHLFRQMGLTQRDAARPGILAEVRK